MPPQGFDDSIARHKNPLPYQSNTEGDLPTSDFVCQLKGSDRSDYVMVALSGCHNKEDTTRDKPDANLQS